MKNAVLLILALSGSFAAHEVYAQGLRGCLGGATDQAGCDYGKHMNTQYKLAKFKLIEIVLETYKKDLMWFAKSMSTPMTQEEVAQELASELANALIIASKLEG